MTCCDDDVLLLCIVDVLRKKQRLDARKMREKAKRQGNTPPPFGSSTRDVSSPKKSPVKPVMYQDELSER